MAIEAHKDGGFTVTGPDVNKYIYSAMVSGLRLECLGMGRRGQSCYGMAKQKFGFKGNKLSVLRQLLDWYKENCYPEGPIVTGTEKFLAERGMPATP